MILVSDNLHIIDQRIYHAVEDMNPEPIREMVQRAVSAGAEAVDINCGPLLHEPERKMTLLVETVQSVTDLPALLDTTNPKALEAGLKVSRNQTIINGFSLEPAKLENILPLAKKYDVDIIGYLLYPNSHVPPDEAERLNIAVEVYTAFQQAGIPDERLIIDPIIAPVIWENGHLQDMEILSVLGHLPEVLGFPVRTIAGISNLTTGQGPRDKKLLLERTYLPMLASAGLSMALMNVFHEESVRTAQACQVLADDKIFTWEGWG